MTEPITVSLVLLTWNRYEAVYKSLNANLKSAGYPIHELIHVDNGSNELEQSEWIRGIHWPTVQVLNIDNIGVAKGYNRGLALTTGSHIVITGCDRIMPQGWLKAFVEAAQAIPNTGAISVYSEEYAGEHQRYQSPIITMNGIKIRLADVCEARFHSREYLLGVGYFREDFGLYSYEDCEWRDRAVAYSRQHNLINYVLPNLGNAIHLEDGNEPDSAMMAMKKREKDSPEKIKHLNDLHTQGNPYFNPYCFEHGKKEDWQPHKGHPDQSFGYVSYAQTGEDIIVCNIIEKLLKIKNPRYLDIGAHHPFNVSNTALLYKRGWRGVNVDANPNLMGEFYKHRPHDVNLCTGVVGDSSIPIATLHMFDHSSGRNSLVKGYMESDPYGPLVERAQMTVPVMTINEVVSLYCSSRFPEFLSIDVEGLDYDIIESAKFDRLGHPLVICVEAIPYCEPEKIIELVENKGYNLLIRLAINLIFVHDSVFGIAAGFERPSENDQLAPGSRIGNV